MLRQVVETFRGLQHSETTDKERKTRSDRSRKRRRSTESRGQRQKEKNGLTRDPTIDEANTQFGWLDLLCIKSHTLWAELKTKIRL